MAEIGSTGPVTGRGTEYSGGIWFGNRVQAVVDFTITHVAYRMDQGRTGINAVPAVYADSAGALGALLSDGPQINDCVIGVNLLALTTPVFVAAGTFVWVGNYQASIGNLFAQIGSGANSSYFIDTPPAPDPGPGLTTWVNSHIIYGVGTQADNAVEGTTSQANALVVAQYVSQEGKISQFNANAVAIYPAEFSKTTQFNALMPIEPDNSSKVSAYETLVVGQGRIDNRQVRVWSFSIDGHDFYVIALGRSQTLVYDLTTGQWAEWSSPDLNVWRAHKGQNWVSMASDTYENHYSNVIAGDDHFGVLWTLNPNVGYDVGPTTGNNLPFIRQVTGGVPGNMRETVPVGAVYLTGSMATPQISGAGITLSTSDDNGTTWTDHGTVTVEESNYDQEFSWRSLGLIKSPGKLFRITDSGGSVRLDSLEMR